jgi:hypothetical protein
MNKLVNEELNKMKYLLGYQKGKVISEQSLVSSTTPPAAAPATQTPAAPAATVEDVVKQIQTTLNTKYGAKLTVDGKWGNLTQTAFEAATKSKPAAAPAAAPTGTNPPAAAPTGTATPAAAPTGTATPAAAPTGTGQKTTDPAIAAAPKVALPSVMAPTIPGVSYQNEPAAQSPDEIVGTEVAPQSNRDQRRDRQDMRRDQRRARQDLRAQQRAQ